jgi:UDP-glucose 4-epimerase
MRVLVTGGCGYIGSHTIVDLLQNGHQVICLDNCSRASSTAIDRIEKITGVRVPLIHMNMCDKMFIATLFMYAPFDAVIHFAAYKAVGESVQRPLAYYENNMQSLLNLLTACDTFDIKNIIFSSSCTVYGEPDKIPVTEGTPIKPASSPYGATKQMGEQILSDCAKKPGSAIKACLLRYFNPAGAHPSGLLGEESTDSPQNLTPVLVQVAAGRRPELQVFGGDYPTPDGSCVRDFIHVCDIAVAHRLALEYMARSQSEPVSVFNLGAGVGVSVLEAIQAFEEATGVLVPHKIVGRREGDVSAVYGDNAKARATLGWKIQYSLKDIMRTAWEYYKKKTAVA